MSDRIILGGIAVHAHHGVLDEEERLGQRFLVSLDCRLDLRPAGRSDDVAETVSYAEIAELAVRVATGRRFRLIEALAEALAGAVLETWGAVEAVTVRIDKPGAPIPAIVAEVAVEITRRRGE